MASKALIRSIIKNGLVLESGNAEALRKTIARSRNQLKRYLDRDPSSVKSVAVMSQLLEEYEEIILEEVEEDISIASSLDEGAREALQVIADIAGIPKEAEFNGWMPVIPINAVTLAQSEVVDLIRNISNDLKQEILETIQAGITAGFSNEQIKDEILGTGLKGRAGKDGVFRSATFRARATGRTVTNELINRGALLTYNQVNQIVPELGLKKIWQVVSDSRTSDRCISLAGQMRDLDEDFRAADGWTGQNPPAHPFCRSRVSSISDRWKDEYDLRFKGTKGLNKNKNKQINERKKKEKSRSKISRKGIDSLTDPNWSANLGNKKKLSTRDTIDQRHPNAKLLGKNLFVETYDKDTELQLKGVDNLSSKAIKILNKERVKTRVGKRILTSYPEFANDKGKTPPGYTPGSTIDDSPGMYMNRQIIVNGKRVTEKTITINAGLKSGRHVLAHEIFHALGDSDRFDRSPKWADIYERNYDKIKVPYLKQGGPKGERGMRELFAESGGLLSYYAFVKGYNREDILRNFEREIGPREIAEAIIAKGYIKSGFY